MPEPIKEIALSRYAARVLAARPELAAELAGPQPFGRHEMAQALAAPPGESEAQFKRRLRRLRQQVLLRAMVRDLAGRASLDEVCAAMSDLAELALEACVKFLGCNELIVVGMGKLGGRELNVSSDIDLVFLNFSGKPEGLEDQAKKLIRLLSGAAPLLVPGGRLVAITCSLEAEENEGVVAAFLAAHPGFSRLPLEEVLVPPLAAGIEGPGAWRILPGADHDGFSVSVLEKARK